MGDIKVQRGRLIMASGALSGSVAIDVVDTTKAFIRVNGLHGLPVGYVDTAGGAGLTTIDRVGATPVFITASGVQITRSATGSHPVYYDFEVWEYTGPVGGPNEFQVFAFTSVQPPAGAVSQGIQVGAIGGFAAALAHNVVVLCGVRSDRATTTLGMTAWYPSSITNFLGFIPLSVLTRQIGADVTGSDTCRVTYAVLSFVGSNWSDTHRTRLTLPAASGNAWHPGVFSTPLGNAGWRSALPFYSWSVDGALAAARDVMNIWHPGNGLSGGASDPSRFSVIRQRNFRISNHVIWAVTNPELDTHFVRSQVGPDDGNPAGITTTYSGTGEARLPAVTAVDDYVDILAAHEPIPSLPRVTCIPNGLTVSGNAGINDFLRIFQLVSGGDVLRWRHDSRATPRTAGWGMTITSWASAVSASLEVSGTTSGGASALFAAVGDFSMSGALGAAAGGLFAASGSLAASGVLGAAAGGLFAASGSLAASGALGAGASALRGASLSMSGILTLSGDVNAQPGEPGDPCDWFTVAAGEDWASAGTAEWYDAAASPDWASAASGDWYDPASGSWLDPKVCG